MKVRYFCKQLTELGCVITKINHLGDDITVGTLGNVMRILKTDGFILEGTKLIARPEAYPEGFVFPNQLLEEQPVTQHSTTAHKEYKNKFVCVLCQTEIEDRPNSTKVIKHIEECKGAKPICAYCHKTVKGSALGLQKHETYCKNREVN